MEEIVKNKIEENKEIEINKDNCEFMNKQQLISFAFDVGFAIIIPLIVLALSGRFLDKKFQTSPLFLIIGILLSLISTGIAIYKKTQKLIK